MAFVPYQIVNTDSATKLMRSLVIDNIENSGIWKTQMKNKRFSDNHHQNSKELYRYTQEFNR